MFLLKTTNNAKLRHYSFTTLAVPRIVVAIAGIFFQSPHLQAQDLDPRTYSRIPIRLTTMVVGFAHSEGGVFTDPMLPLKDLRASIQTPSLGLAHSFNFFGMTSQALIAVPYSFAKATATVNDQPQEANRSGFSDMRLRFSFLFKGAPAATVQQLAKVPRKTVLGASINVIAPTGQYFPDKLINLGTHRWSFRPELALSQPAGKRWLIDVYAGVWLFTNNHSFYTGNSFRTQQPLGTFQAHISYNVGPIAWVALDATYYTGGRSTINGTINDDRQANARIGATLVWPLGKTSSIKIAGSTGAIVRYGANFSTVSVGWQKSWIGKKKQK